MANSNEDKSSADGIDRRGFLKCMAWAGTGMLWTISGGILSSRSLSQPLETGQAGGKPDFTFVQISDSHIGFTKDANKDVIGTFDEAIAKIKALPMAPSLLLHTGDITHLSKSDEFDVVDQKLNAAKINAVFTVPGEHDIIEENGKVYKERYGKSTQGDGWYSFTTHGVHFIGLVNVFQTGAKGLGVLGNAQLDWLEKDVKRLPASTPIVVFAHVPLWSVYPDWGWGTEDSAQALGYLKRFGSVTVLNGHIHQTMQKVEGNVTFHTAMSTAFPQPTPGGAAAPGPMKVDAGKLQGVLGITKVNYVRAHHSLAIVDSTLNTKVDVEDSQ